MVIVQINKYLRMRVKELDTMIILHLLFIRTLNSQSDCSFAGFPCCQKPVPSPVYDNNKNGYLI